LLASSLPAFSLRDTTIDNASMGKPTMQLITTTMIKSIANESTLWTKLGTSRWRKVDKAKKPPGRFFCSTDVLARRPTYSGLIYFPSD
jgi:hypothetical protein